MNYKVIIIVLTVLGLLIAVVGVTWQIANGGSENKFIQMSNGSNSSNITVNESSGDVNLNLPAVKKGVEIPSFSGQIQPLSENDFKNEGRKFLNSSKFNDFMLANDGKIVYLDIWPYYTDENLDTPSFSQFEFPTWIVINNAPYASLMESLGGNEYSIQAENSDDFFFDSRQSSRRLVGNFKIIGVSGPMQGYMSVIMKPVSMEMVELLKK